MEFLYLSQGFTVNIDYFISKITEDNHFLKIILDNHKYNDIIYDVDMIFEHKKNCIISFEYRNSKNYHHDSYMAGRIASLNRHPLSPSEGKSSNYKLVKPSYYKDNTTFFEKINIIPILRKMRNNVLSIQELSWEYSRKNVYQGGAILNKLLENYFGGNVIIPYDMKERKRTYKDAFDDLKDYMKDYEKK